MAMKRCSVLIGFAVLLHASSVLAATYHVALDGSDGNPGSESRPWRTIQKAARDLQPGDTVSVERTPATVAVDIVQTFFRVGFSAAFPTF